MTHYDPSLPARRLSPTDRVARWSATNPLKAIAAWLIVIAVTFGISFTTGIREATQLELSVGESAQAMQMTEDAGKVDLAVENILIRGAGDAFDLSAARAAGDAVTTDFAALPGVASVLGPLPSKSGNALLYRVEMTGDPDSARDRVEPLLAETAKIQAAHPAVVVEEVGTASIRAEFGEWLNNDVEKATSLSLPVTLVILLIAFGAIVMAGIPVLLAISSVASALGLWALASQLVPDAGMTLHLIVLVGMAVGVDYSLFYLRRFREERRRGRGQADAVAVAAATAGHSVIVSGVAVVLSMAGLYVAQDTMFSALATGAILVVLVSLISSLTILPALLATLGRWSEKPRVPFVWRLFDAPEPRLVAAILRPVVRFPVIAAVCSVAILILLALPVIGMSLQSTQTADFPRSLSTMQRYDELVKEFPDTAYTDTIVVRVPSAQRGELTTQFAAVAERVQSRDDLYGAVAEPWISADGRTGVLNVTVPHALDSGEARASVQVLRDDIVPKTLGGISGAETAVGGDIALDMDYTGNLDAKLPLVIGIVVALTFLIMFAVYRSVAIGLVTVVLNLLSTLAAFGILTLVFQGEWAQGLLGFTSNGHIVSWVPMLLFVVLSGLSLDYHVFVVSRIRENVSSGMTIPSAVFAGVTRTAGVVTTAAIIMVAVFSIFAALSFIELKQIGVGLAVAILIDATLIRVVTLPALLMVLRRVLWWPGRLGPDARESVRAETVRGRAPSGGMAETDDRSLVH